MSIKTIFDPKNVFIRSNIKLGGILVNEVDFHNPDSKEKWRKFVLELYNKYYSDYLEDEGYNLPLKEKRRKKKEKKKENEQEKRKKQAQRVAKKARQEEELKERKSKIKTLLPLDDNPVEKPKKRGRPPKDNNKEQIRTKQKTLL